jgi:hypothetical protein
MSKRTRLAAMAAAVVLACLSASVRADTPGNELLDYCTSQDASERGYCYGYVNAIAEAERRPAGFNGWYNCLPAESTRKQLVDVVKRWLDQHPEQRHYSAAGLIAQALSEAFPCKR